MHLKISPHIHFARHVNAIKGISTKTLIYFQLIPSPSIEATEAIIYDLSLIHKLQEQYIKCLK